MLTDPKCRNATCPPDQKKRRLTDSGGLYLEVSPAGSKRWFWKFYPQGKESRLALGSYPEVNLKAARQARDDARKLKQAGMNPVQQRKAEALAKATSNATTFEAVAREFHGTKSPTWSASHSTQWLRCCENDLFPHLGSLPLAAVSAPLLLETLRKVQKRGALRLAHEPATLRPTFAAPWSPIPRSTWPRFWSRPRRASYCGRSMAIPVSPRRAWRWCCRRSCSSGRATSA